MAINCIREDTCQQLEFDRPMEAEQRIRQGSSQLGVIGLNGQTNEQNELDQYGDVKDRIKEDCAIARTTGIFSEVV